MEKIQDKNNNKIGKIISIFGIILNIFLATGKILVGSLFGLISIVADGLNNLTDCGSSVVSLISFKFSSKPADKEHPYGHGRLEYVCSLFIAFIMLFVAFDTIKESIAKIASPSDTVFSYWIIAVLVFSIVIKFILFVSYKHFSKKLNSSILSATATDSLMDCIATSITLISVIVSHSFQIDMDGYAGIFVALFIAWSAYQVTKDIVSNLIGKAPDDSLINGIKSKILSYDGVLAVHDLSVYNYGANQYFASAHVEVSASIDVLISHELIDNIERDFARDTNIILTGHLDPVETDNPEVNELKLKVNEIAKNIDEKFSIHDLRIVKGEKNTNVLFDLVIPYDTKIPKDQLRETITNEIKNINSVYSVILTIEYGI